MHEFYLLLEAYTDRERREHERMTWSMAWLMWSAGIPNWKSGVHAGTLMNALRAKETDKTSPLEMRRQKFLSEHPEALM